MSSGFKCLNRLAILVGEKDLTLQEAEQQLVDEGWDDHYIELALYKYRKRNKEG